MAFQQIVLYLMKSFQMEGGGVIGSQEETAARGVGDRHQDDVYRGEHNIFDVSKFPPSHAQSMTFFFFF